MRSVEIRQKFLKFFEKNGHTIVPSSSLIPPDPSVLFTSAGMQQFKPYYLGQPCPYGKNVASCQKCLRTSDIEEVGKSPRHLTFFEMLGNFSFGGYFKEGAIALAFEFLFKELGLDPKDFLFTVFAGDQEIPPDEESPKIWQKLGIPKEKIKKCSREDNFWGPTGKEGPCGPTTEIHFAPTGKLEEGIEIWNLVFNEYYQDENKKLTPLTLKGVDTGMGLERLALVLQKKQTVFETDLFFPIINLLTSKPQPPTSHFSPLTSFWIIADHLKAAVFLISEGIFPSNLERGYVLRRLLRRAILHGRLLDLPKDFLIQPAQKIIEIYQGVYPELKSKETEILTVIQKEQEKFEKTLKQGLKKFEKIAARAKERDNLILGEDAFHLFDTFGFPLELTVEMAKEKNLKVDLEGFKKAFEKHRVISRAGAERKFGGIGYLPSKEAVKLHTATHLLHSALRKILGEKVRQMGSDITPERLRFDFSFERKLTKEELEEVQRLVQQKIDEGLSVERLEMPLKEALAMGALAFFKEKYPEWVSVYKIWNPKTGEIFSLEICAGPHVQNTKELGTFQIVKEESAGAGVRRLRAILK